MTIERQIYNHIALILRDYEDITDYLDKRRRELMTPVTEPDENIGGGKSNVMTNTAEQTAVTIADDVRMNQLRKQRQAVDRCLAESDSYTQTIIRELYLKRRPEYTVDGVAQMLNLGPRTVQRYRKRFFNRMAELLGW